MSLQTKAEQVFSVLRKESQLRPSQRTQQRPLSANNRDGVTIFSHKTILKKVIQWEIIQ